MGFVSTSFIKFIIFFERSRNETATNSNEECSSAEFPPGSGSVEATWTYAFFVDQTIFVPNLNDIPAVLENTFNIKFGKISFCILII